MVKLGLRNLTPSEKVELARHIIQNMTGNANFATPTPTLAALEAAADDLETAQAALNGSKIKTQERNTAEEALVSKLNQMQGYVQMASNGDKTIILSSGMDVNDARTAVGKLGPVTDLTAKLGQFEGTVDLKWKGFKKKVSYRIYATDQIFPAGEYQFIGETTKQKFTATGLNSNQVYQFRIVCFTSAGAGPASETISIRVY